MESNLLVGGRPQRAFPSGVRQESSACNVLLLCVMTITITREWNVLELSNNVHTVHLSPSAVTRRKCSTIRLPDPGCVSWIDRVRKWAVSILIWPILLLTSRELTRSRASGDPSE